MEADRNSIKVIVFWFSEGDFFVESARPRVRKVINKIKNDNDNQ